MIICIFSSNSLGKQVDKQKIETEYDNFMAELGLDSGPQKQDTCMLVCLCFFFLSCIFCSILLLILRISSHNLAARTDAEKSYEEFMNAIQSHQPQAKATPQPMQYAQPPAMQQQRPMGYPAPYPGAMPGQQVPWGTPLPMPMQSMNAMQQWGPPGMQQQPPQWNQMQQAQGPPGYNANPWG
jgi:hypothetical protein